MYFLSPKLINCLLVGIRKNTLDGHLLKWNVFMLALIVRVQIYFDHESVLNETLH